MKSRRLRIVVSALAVACALFAVFAVLPLIPSVSQGGGEGVLQATGASSAEGDGASQAMPRQASNPETNASASDTPDQVSAEVVGADAGVQAGSAPAYESDSVLVTLADGVTPETLIESLPDATASGFVVEKQGAGYVKLGLPDGLDPQEAAKQLNATGLVEGAQPNYYYHTMGDFSTKPNLSTLTPAIASTSFAQAAVANDPRYSKQWALPSVNAPEAWRLVDANVSTNPAVTVAVIDAGFRVDHLDLKDHIVDTYNAATRSSVIGFDNADHGTHVAGIVSAVANNKVGVAGVVNNACGLMLVRVSDSNGDISTECLADGFAHVIKERKTHNVHVANLSLGSLTDTRVTEKTDPALYKAIDTARKAGIVTVAAACNSEDDFSALDIPSYAYPSDFDNVVSVINLEKSKNDDGVKRNKYSNYNKRGDYTKNISAPGTSIYSTWDSGKNSYCTSDGTSMASPLVAGIVGLMFTVNPNLTPEKATSILHSTAKDLVVSPASNGWDRYTGFGEVDAEAAVKAAGAVKTTEKKSIASATIKVADSVYTGKPVKPRVTVKMGSITLGKGSDYSVEYRDNTNVGKATVVVHGKGKYCGIAVCAFTIEKRVLSSLTLKSTKAVYNGSSCKPVIKSVKAGSSVISSSDYTVKYLRSSHATSNFKSVGTITVKVSGKGNFAGAVTKKFTIYPKATSITKMKADKRKLVVTWKRRSAQTTGYQLAIATNKKFTAGVKKYTISNNSNTRKTIKSLKEKKVYYAKVRTFKTVDGQRYYSSWSPVKKKRTL